MQQDKSVLTDKQKTSDQFSSAPSIDYPEYLDIIKMNIQSYLPNYNVTILSKDKEPFEYEQDQNGCYSIIISSPKVFKSKFQILTQTFLDQRTYSFYVKHLVTFNHGQLRIENRQTIMLSLSLCNKINSFLQYFRLVIHPVSGKIHFQTKSLINQSSLSHLKKHIPKQDCFYTEVIVNSLKKAQKYLDLLLLLLGQITLQQILKNQQIHKQFPFLAESQEILRRIQKNLFYLSFADLKFHKTDSIFQKIRHQESFNFKLNENSFFSLYQENLNSINKIQLKEKYISQVKQRIIKNTLQYFSQNTQKILKQFTDVNLYQNIDFSQGPFETVKNPYQMASTLLDSEQKSSTKNKNILSNIQILQEQNEITFNSQNQNWKPVSEGGFGIIQLGTIKFKNLQNSQSQPQTGFSFVIKQQVIRKRDKNSKKGKILRQRNILQKLRFFSHPNIMNFYISFQNIYQNCIFSDYTPNMSLDLYLKKHQMTISLQRKISFLIQAVEGLKFLHAKTIVHLDIKPGNMLISKNLRLLLSDFGQAFLINQDDPVTHNHAYTIPYCAPQIFHEKAQLTEKADIYAIGVCILKIILGNHVFQTFIKRKFVKRLCKHEIIGFGLGQKFQKSLLNPIFKILAFVAFKAISQSSSLRPQLSWIGKILQQCRNFILKLFS